MSLLLSRAVVRARHSAVALSASRAAAAASAAVPAASCVAARCASATRCGCGCGAAGSVLPAAAAVSACASRSFHWSARSDAPATPAASKKKKEVVERGPMVVPASLSEYDFSFLNVLKEYKDPNDKVASRPDAAYPSWIYDQTPEPAWGDLLLADFASLPTTYQKRVFSMPRKQEIKRKNDLTRKG